MEMMIAVMTPAGFSLILSKHFDAHRRAPQLVCMHHLATDMYVFYPLRTTKLVLRESDV